MEGEDSEYGLTVGALSQINWEKFLEAKLKKAREHMKKYGLDAVLCLTGPNICYITNLFHSNETALNYAILPIEGDPIYFGGCDVAFHVRKHIPYIAVEQAVPVGGGPYDSSETGAKEYLLREFAEQIEDTIKKLKLDMSAIGIDANLPYIVNALKKQGIRIGPDGSKVLLETTLTKLPEERQIFRRLLSVVDGCFGVAARVIRTGVTERELAGELGKYAFNQGVTPTDANIMSGPHTWPKDHSHWATDRRFRPYDTVVIDIRFEYAGYESCCYRTFSVGPAQSDVKEAYKNAITLLRDAENILRPGITTKDVVEKWPDEMELWANRPPFIKNERSKLSTYWNNMGHGLGLLTNHHPPWFWRPLSLKWPQKIEAGMVIALETQDGTRDNRCGVRIEDDMIITDTGYEMISNWPADEITETPL